MVPPARKSPGSVLPEVGVLIAAAGHGERSGGTVRKQFRDIAGAPMLLRAIRPFIQLPAVREIVVALPPDVAACPPPWLADLAGERLKLAHGGASRALSVRAALAQLDAACTVILVHDAARPFVSLETVRAVSEAVSHGSSVVAGVPLADTLKRADPETNCVLETVDRCGLWRAHTPQGFPRAILERAFRDIADATLGTFTDEAAAVEAAGFPVRLIVDRSDNIKITSAEDFALAEALAAR